MEGALERRVVAAALGVGRVGREGRARRGHDVVDVGLRGGSNLDAGTFCLRAPRVTRSTSGVPRPAAKRASALKVSSALRDVESPQSRTRICPVSPAAASAAGLSTGGAVQEQKASRIGKFWLPQKASQRAAPKRSDLRSSLERRG